MKLIQVKFPWGDPGSGPGTGSCQGNMGTHCTLEGSGKKRGSVTEKKEETSQVCLGRPLKIRGVHSTCETYGHNMLLGGGNLKDLQRPVCTDGTVGGELRWNLMSPAWITLDK